MKGQINLLDEIIVDNFAGGGGASTGIELATGTPVTIAINHDPASIAMHRINHPYTKHYSEDVWEVNPIEVCQGRKVALAWFSPDCKHFSKAKGGKPVEKKIRGLAWVAVRWAATVKPRVIMLENVEEFKTWGPIKDGYPDINKKGRTFKSFVNALKRLGYEVEWKELKACDYGAPTIRKRFFLIARSDGKPIRWPEATHGKGLKPYRTAAEIIDWSIPCKSIFDRKKPLAENTMKRIARGLEKFVINCVEPYIVSIGQTGFSQDRSRSIHDPLNTIVTKQEQCLITPTLIKTGYGEREGQAARVPGLDKPLETIVSSCKHAVVAPSLIQYHSETAEGEVRGQSVEKPIMTLDSSPRYGLVSAFLAKHYGGTYTGAGSEMNEPLHTITSTDHNALVTANIVTLRNNMDGRSMNEPVPTITAGGGHIAEVRAFLIKYYGQGTGQKLDIPLDTIVSKDRFGLVTVKGTDYIIADIGMRMLEPHELYAAQGFPSDYIIDFDVNGKKYSKKDQVARCGNSVPPPFAEALVRANLPELCKKEYVTMAELKADIAM